jgi:hypothetical protein
MPRPVVVDIPHELGKDGARQRLQNGFTKLREQFGFGALTFEERWEGDFLHFSAQGLGQNIVGRVDVMEKLVRIELDLPWALGVLAEKLQGRIRSAGTLLLEKK